MGELEKRREKGIEFRDANLFCRETFVTQMCLLSVGAVGDLYRCMGKCCRFEQNVLALKPIVVLSSSKQ
jgi:hypothetical protein